MPFKYDQAGNIVTQESDVGGKKVLLPVFVGTDGKEAPFDADSTVGTISRLNREAQGHREAKEKAEQRLQAFAGIEDPAAALKAMETVKNFNDKQLVDAGEVERIRTETTRAMQEKLDAEAAARKAAEDKLFNTLRTNAFATSKFVKEKLAPHIPPDFVEAKFGDHFGIDEHGKFYAVDATGNKVFSRSRPGELADFDEAMGILVESHPSRDSLLRGSGASGGGTPPGGGSGGGGKRTITRSQFEALPVHERPKAAAEMTIVDG